MAEIISKSNLISSNYKNYNNQQKNNQFIEPIRCSISIKNCSSNFRSNFLGLKLDINSKNNMIFPPKKRNPHVITSKLGLSIGKAQKWWEKGLQPNMKEITSAQDLVDSLLGAGDKLVVVDFFSPGCGGCKALHPKICRLAEMNPDFQFLQVNYEEHKSMCYSLNVHVLPFFRFYRGAEGRVCSFSCTNATIKKFKDALARYGPDQCSVGPAKGLEEKELLALAANKDLSFTYTPKPSIEEPTHVPVHEEVSPSPNTMVPYFPPSIQKSSQVAEEKTPVAAGS